MQVPAVPDPAFSALWRNVLERMEESLKEVEAEAAAREQALPETFGLPLPDPERLAGFVDQVTPADTWLDPIQAAVRHADQLVAETNAVLQAEEEALRDWLRAVEAGRQRLADWEKRTARPSGI